MSRKGVKGGRAPGGCNGDAGRAWRRAQVEALATLGRKFLNVPPEDLEDAVSSATAYLWARPPGPDVRLAQALVKNSKGRVLNAQRDALLARTRLAAVAAEYPPPCSSEEASRNGPLGIACRMEMARLARTAPGIPEASRETLAALIEGRSFQEIAEERGVSADCVRKQAERGAAVLSRLIAASEATSAAAPATQPETASATAPADPIRAIGD